MSDGSLTNGNPLAGRVLRRAGHRSLCGDKWGSRAPQGRAHGHPVGL